MHSQLLFLFRWCDKNKKGGTSYKTFEKTILEPKGPLHYHLSLVLLYIFDSAAAMKVITGTEYNTMTLTAEMGKI